MYTVTLCYPMPSWSLMIPVLWKRVLWYCLVSWQICLMIQAERNCGSDVQSSLCCAVLQDRADSCPSRVSSYVPACFVAPVGCKITVLGRTLHRCLKDMCLPCALLWRGQLSYPSWKSREKRDRKDGSLSFICDLVRSWVMCHLDQWWEGGVSHPDVKTCAILGNRG